MNVVAARREEIPVVLSIHFPRQDVVLDIREGECVALLEDGARSGLALLDALAGKTAFAPGRLYVDGQDVTDMPPAQRPIACVDDPLAIPAWRSAHGYMLRAMGPEPADRRERREAANQLLQAVEWHRATHAPLMRVTAEEQRLLRLACALASGVRVLLLTHPLPDGQLAWLCQVGIAVVMLVDSLAAAGAAHRVAVMHAGGIDCVASPRNLAHAPLSAYAARRAGRVNMLRVRVAARGPGKRLALDLDGLIIPAQAEMAMPPLDTLAWLCVDPADIRVSRRMEGAFHLSAVAEGRQEGGVGLRLPGGQRIVAQAAVGECPRPGERVCVRWDIAAARVLWDSIDDEEMISC